MDDADRRAFALFGVLAAALAFGWLAAAGAQWLTGNFAVSTGVMLLTVAIVFGVASMSGDQTR